MAVSLFYVELSNNISPEFYNKLQQTFPEKIQHKIALYPEPKERQLRISGKALLQYGLQQLGLYPNVSLKDYDYTENRKPFLKGEPIQFSLSHNGNIVACVFSDNSDIGVDIEKKTPVKLELMKFYFNTESWQEIINAPDIETEFYRQWTMREATVKASGLLIDPMELAEITIDASSVQLRATRYECSFPFLHYDYMTCVATEGEIDEMNIFRVDADVLLLK